MKNKFMLITLFFVLIGRISCAENIVLEQSNNPYERINNQAMEIWTTLDLLNAINLTDESRTMCAYELIDDFLDFYALIQQWISLTRNSINKEQCNEIIELLDFLREALSHVYKYTQDENALCIFIILGKIESKLANLID